jgi:hypothetical protein
MGGNSMRFRTSLCLATLFLFFFTITAWSTPHPILAAGYSEPIPDNQSLSGQITSVGDAEFSVQVAKNKDSSTVQFMVDDQTKVEGKLAVGAQATVEYRSNEGKNIAVRVIVTATSGLHS